MAGFRDKLQRMFNPPDDEYEYDDYYDEEEPQEPARTSSAYEEPRRVTTPDYGFSTFSSRGREEGKVVNISGRNQMQVVVFRPMSFGDEAWEIADELLKRHAVVLNLEKTEKDVSRRIVDFLSGVAYANNGKIKRVATATFIITPYNMDLTGDDLLDELEGSGLYF